MRRKIGPLFVKLTFCPVLLTGFDVLPGVGITGEAADGDDFTAGADECSDPLSKLDDPVTGV